MTPRERQERRGLRRPSGFAPVLIALSVLVAAGALIAWKVGVAVHVGPGWDTYAFLANAAEFAGKGYGYTEPHRAPVLPLLVSLVFRFGQLHEAAIQWVDGALTLFGLAGAYLLFRRRFTPVLAGLGALALLGVAPLWAYVGVGYTDMASVGLMCWLLLVLIKGTEDGPAWFLAAGPLFVAASMTRFTALLFAFTCLVWLSLRASFFRHAKALAVSAALAVAAYVPLGAYYQRLFGEALFPLVVALGFSETVATTGTETASGTTMFYLAGAPTLLGPASLAVVTAFVLLVALASVGSAAAASLHAATVSRRRMALAIAGVAVVVGAQAVGGLAMRQGSIALAVMMLWRALGPRDENGVPTAEGALDAAMIAWFAAYLDFHGHQTILVPRYFIPMAVPVVYLVLRGWDSMAERAQALGRYARPAAAFTLAAFVAASLVVGVLGTPYEQDRVVIGARETAQWLAQHPDARDAIVYSDVWPLTAWYRRGPARAMPSHEDTRAYAHELDKSGADYYVTIRTRRYPTFTEAYRRQGAIVLERTAPGTPLPRVLYLGKSWDNYLERVADFDVYVDSTAGRYGWEGTAFLDGATPEALSRADAVAVFGAKWRDRAASEAALRRYVENGGSLVVDASKNLDGLAYSLADTVMFDTVVRRRTLRPDATITLDRAFAQRHDLRAPQAAPFVDEGGGVWAGASYEERPDSLPLRVLARVDGRPLVAVQPLGRGHIYWVGFNLPWHAFSKESPSEAALVRAVLDEAIEQARDRRASK